MSGADDAYPVILSRRGALHVLRLPALYLVVEDEDLARGWQRLEAEKQALIDRYRALGAGDELPRPDAGTAPPWRGFAIKAGIVTLAMVVVVAAAAFSFSYAVREPLRKVGAKLGRAAIAQVESGLRQAAADELTPERREDIRILVAEAAPHLRPYVRELRPLLADLCPTK